MKKKRNRLIFSTVGTFFVLFCVPQEATSEEFVIPTPLEILSTDGVPPMSPSLSEETLFDEEAFPLQGLGRTPFEELSTNLPEGREVASQILQGKFVVGKRSVSLIYHPKVTLSFRAEGGLKHYMTGTPPVEGWHLLTEEEKVDRGFRFAESLTRTVQSLPVPLLGDFLAHCLRLGRKVERFDKNLKTKYHFHLKYSDETFQASYKDAF